MCGCNYVNLKSDNSNISSNNNEFNKDNLTPNNLNNNNNSLDVTNSDNNNNYKIDHNNTDKNKEPFNYTEKTKPVEQQQEISAIKPKKRKLFFKRKREKKEKELAEKEKIKQLALKALENNANTIKNTENDNVVSIIPSNEEKIPSLNELLVSILIKSYNVAAQSINNISANIIEKNNNIQNYLTQKGKNVLNSLYEFQNSTSNISKLFMFFSQSIKEFTNEVINSKKLQHSYLFDFLNTRLGIYNINPNYKINNANLNNIILNIANNNNKTFNEKKLIKQFNKMLNDVTANETGISINEIENLLQSENIIKNLYSSFDVENVIVALYSIFELIYDIMSDKNNLDDIIKIFEDLIKNYYDFINQNYKKYFDHELKKNKIKDYQSELSSYIYITSEDLSLENDSLIFKNLDNLPMLKLVKDATNHAIVKSNIIEKLKQEDIKKLNTLFIVLDNKITMGSFYCFIVYHSLFSQIKNNGFDDVLSVVNAFKEYFYVQYLNIVKNI